MVEVIRQHPWTEAELCAEGFRHYERKKEIVMARRLPAAEAPLRVTMNQEVVTIPAGYIICYTPGKDVQHKLTDYGHWPCANEDFEASYAEWDEPGWKPKPAERDLMARGCRPYYKNVGVWAKRLNQPAYLQSKESPQPFLVPAGDWVVIGNKGAPYHMDDAGFRSRYNLKSLS